MKEKKGNYTIIATVRLHETEEYQLPEDLPEALVHVFDRNGEQLTSVPLPKSGTGYGQVKINLPARLKGQSVRLVLGPPQQDRYDNVPPLDGTIAWRTR